MEEVTRMPLIGDKAPDFHAITTQGKINFPEDYYGRWVILFSHPADFTPVCTTEFMTFASMINEFKIINTELVGLSIDSIYAHIAWLRKIRELAWKDMKHVDVTFPLIADVTMEIAKQYGMMHPSNSGTQTVRAVFIIDPESKIRAVLYYPASTGRNIQEIKRIILSLQMADSENIATPANWEPCEDVILPPPSSCEAAKECYERIKEDVYCMDWFLCFQQSNCATCKKEYEPENNQYPSMYPARNRYHYRRQVNK